MTDQEIEKKLFDILHRAQSIIGDVQDLQQEIAKRIVEARRKPDD